MKHFLITFTLYPSKKGSILVQEKLFGSDTQAVRCVEINNEKRMYQGTILEGSIDLAHKKALQISDLFFQNQQSNQSHSL